jgi:hypothetical protein
MEAPKQPGSSASSFSSASRRCVYPCPPPTYSTCLGHQDNSTLMDWFLILLTLAVTPRLGSYLPPHFIVVFAPQYSSSDSFMVSCSVIVPKKT